MLQTFLHSPRFVEALVNLAHICGLVLIIWILLMGLKRLRREDYVED